MKHIVEGNIAVKACLLGNKRQVFELLVDEKKHDKDTNFIIAKAHEQGVIVRKGPREHVDALAEGTTHGGMVALVSDSIYDSFENYLDTDFIAYVEGIEDPYNFGYVCRSLYAAGCKLLLVQDRNWMNAVNVVTKSSAGASEYLPMAIIDEETIAKAKENGFTFACGNRKDAVSVYETNLNTKVLLGIGGEMRGLSSKVAAQADVNIYIPYANDFRNSLNGASAVSVLAFEIFRQKQQG